MSEKKQLGLAMRFMRHFNKEEMERVNLLDEPTRVLMLGPKRGPEDTIETRIQFLREQDAKATKH